MLLFLLLSYFPKKKGVFWGHLSQKCRRQITHITQFFFSLVISSKGLNKTGISVTFYLISVVQFISNDFANHIRNSSLMSQFHAKISKIG